jgi:hypothetical protein
MRKTAALLVLLVGCGGGGAPAMRSPGVSDAGPEAAANRDTGTPPTAGADAGSTGADAAGPDAAAVLDTGAAEVAVDAGAEARASDAAPGPSVADLLNRGAHFCLVNDEGGAWLHGWQTVCRIVVPMSPPLTPTQKLQADLLCTADRRGMVVPSCPATDAVASCDTSYAPERASVVQVIYRSPVTPDTESVALDGRAVCGLAPVRDVNGAPVERVCKGHFSALVDGQPLDFTQRLACWYESDGTRERYTIEGSTGQHQELVLVIKREGGVAAWELNVQGAAGGVYTEAGVPFPLPVDPARRPLQVSAFASAGSHLAATFSLGQFGNTSGTPRTITGGSIDIAITAP